MSDTGIDDLALKMAINLVIDHVLHELKRAKKGPIYRVCKGGIAPLHDIAVSWGWFRPLSIREPRCRCHGLKECGSTKQRIQPNPMMLALTPMGKQVLAEREEQRRTQ